jgi:hypothetical protein
MPKYYELCDDLESKPTRWYLGSAVDENGVELSPWLFNCCKKVDKSNAVRFIKRLSGRRVDITFADIDTQVITPKVGDILERLAPMDIQRIPVRIEGENDPFEILNILSTVNCVDESRCDYVLRLDDRFGEKSGKIGGIMGLRIRQDEIRGQEIFRPADYHVIIVCSEKIKLALEDAKVTGVYFTDVT